ncbi:MAG TPA: oligopeptide/dipeptide ABC transporter ATP-binding protein [Nitrososphaerales archaeon]|nr:oligopeptide/dipeptide ABC transporter ATP-binding protein [Nitrososphaerales archaeon]
MAQYSSLVELEDLRKWFPIRSGLLSRTVGYVKAVDGVSFKITNGETMGLVGESGCGKTTLARTLLRLTAPTGGKVLFSGKDMTKAKGKALREYRRMTAVVFQDPYASLDPRQTVKSAITEPMKIHHLVRGKDEANQRAADLIRLVGLNPDHLSRYPHEFSGGQRQRIAIARALAVSPEFLVLDEPTSSLDVSVQAQILNLLKALQKDLKLTYLFISHNLSVIRYMCHRTAVMYLGRVVEVADTARIYQSPKHPYTHALLNSAPIPDPAKRKRGVVIEGDVPSPVNIPPGCRFKARCPYSTDRCAKEFPKPVQVRPGQWVECLYDLDLRVENSPGVRA